MKNSLLYKITASIFALFIITACNGGGDDGEQENPEEEQGDIY